MPGSNRRKNQAVIDAMSPLVSVVIPCYNAEPWIAEAIGSALTQTHSPVEVIVIDDGSTDRSLEVIKSFGGQIRWEAGPNRGGDRARNRGFVLSAGEYIQFLDADDYLLPAKIERQMRVFGNGSADVVYEDCQNLFENAAGGPSWGPLDISGAHADILETLLTGWAPPPCALLFSRSAVDKAGGWNEELTSAQDNDFYLRLALAGATFAYAPGCESVYRHPLSPRVSTRNIRVTDENLIRVLREARDKLRDSGRLTLNYKRAIAQSWFGVARKYFDTDFNWYSSLLDEALELSPSIAGRQSRKYRILARALGISRTEKLRSLKRKGIRRLKNSVPASGNGPAPVSADRLPILLYHSVSPPPVNDPFSLTIAPDQFESQMCWLKSRGYQTIWPSDLLAARRTGRPLPRKPLMLTFDDAYADLAEYALPILRRHGLKAAVYVVAGRLGLTNTWDEVNGHRTMRLMSAEQIREWARQGIEFGSHTRTHPHLAALSERELTDEIEGSKEDLKRLLGAEVLSFAYPYGEGAQFGAVRKHLSHTYQLGLTIREGLNTIETNPYELLRATILPSDTERDFDFKLRFGKTRAPRLHERLFETIRRAARLDTAAADTQWNH